MSKIKTIVNVTALCFFVCAQPLYADDQTTQNHTDAPEQGQKASAWDAFWGRLFSSTDAKSDTQANVPEKSEHAIVQKKDVPKTDSVADSRKDESLEVASDNPSDPNILADENTNAHAEESTKAASVRLTELSLDNGDKKAHQALEKMESSGENTATYGPNLKIELKHSSIQRAQRPVENKKILQQIHQYQKEVTQLCEDMGNLLGSVSIKGCLSHNFSHGGSYSVKGRALVYKDIYPNGVSSDQANKLAKILVIGGIHGDEYSSFSIIFRWLERLSKDKKDIQQYWRFIPAANPDGLLSFKPAQRMNANGVDLNRNFLTNDWRDKAIEYWESKTGKDARRNPGKKAASEPETVWLSGMIEYWQPDVIVSVHAPYGILDFDATDQVDVRAPNKIGMLHLKLLGTYPGSLGRYAALNRGIPVLTMELPNAGIMPSKTEQEHLWQDLQKWLNQNI